MNLVEMSLGFQGGWVDNITGETVQGNNNLLQLSGDHPCRSQLSSFLSAKTWGAGDGQILGDWFNLLTLMLS